MMAKRTKKKAKAKRKRVSDAAFNRLHIALNLLVDRVDRIEEFLGGDLKVFHEKQLEPSDEQRVQQADG
jgi:hypothetical protein